MEQSFLVPFENAGSEFEEKRSRFISHLYRVTTEEEARARIDEIKKKYHDARHNCWCYVLHDGAVRYGDDGEPQGTAGQPMLSVFQREGVENVVCIVTRYFGGILLGAGGLVRAYAQGSKTALDAAGVVVMEKSARYLVEVDYSTWQRLEYFLRSAPVIVEHNEFGASVVCTLMVRVRDAEHLLAEITRVTDGSAEILPDDKLYYPWPDEE